MKTRAFQQLMICSCCSLWGTLVYDMLLCNIVAGTMYGCEPGMLEPCMVVRITVEPGKLLC